MSQRLTRRQLGAVAGSFLAVKTLPAAQPAQPPSQADDLERARATRRANIEALSKIKLPMSAEPAFRFEA